MPEAGTVVRIAEFKVGKGPEILSALGLGSCVAVMLWDPASKLGGLAHVMLPSSQAFPPPHNPGKFADTSIPAMVNALLKEGARKDRLAAKLVGGSNMFGGVQGPEVLPLGLRNVMAAREALRSLWIPLRAEEVGGAKGRTLHFQCADGMVLVRKVYQPDAWL